MNQVVRTVLVVGGLLMALLAALFFAQWTSSALQGNPDAHWATALAPWPISPISYGFVASMQAAIAAAMLWVGLSGELGALAAGSLNLIVMMGGLAYSFWQLAPTVESNYSLQGLAVVCAIFAIFNLWLFFWSRRIPIRNPVPMPPTIRLSYVVFVIVLAGVGGSLVFANANIVPWPVSPDPFVAATRTLFGWMFLSDAFYFLYALFVSHWNSARAQLWSFLLYSLVLIPPLGLRLSQTLTGDNEIFWSYLGGLGLYLLILLYSIVLAVYYLFINPRTRPNR